MKAGPWWGGRKRARYATPDLSYYWEGGESSTTIINGMKRKKKEVGVVVMHRLLAGFSSIGVLLTDTRSSRNNGELAADAQQILFVRQTLDGVAVR